MNPGVYAIQGNLNINGPTLVASGVTIYMTYGNGYAAGTTAMIQNINGTVSAPTTGTWQGILYFADRSLGGRHAGTHHAVLELLPRLRTASSTCRVRRSM